VYLVFVDIYFQLLSHFLCWTMDICCSRSSRSLFSLKWQWMSTIRVVRLTTWAAMRFWHGSTTLCRQISPRSRSYARVSCCHMLFLVCYHYR